VNGLPLADLIKRAPRNGGARSLGINGTLAYLTAVGGYDVAHHQSTEATIARGNGRDLTAADAGTANVLLNAFLHTLGPLHLKVGDRITLANQARTRTATVTVVGFYSAGFVSLRLASILASRQFVQGFGGATTQVGYSLQVDPPKVDAAVAQLSR